jgi:hypothetical protein
VLLLAALTARAGAMPPAAIPPYLPRYDADIDLDVAGHQARVRLHATWTNPHATPTRELVFNAHSRYVVPSGQVGFMAKMLEILRVPPSEALGIATPPLDVHRITLVPPAPAPPGQEPAPAETPGLPFRYEGDTKTSLVVDLPRPVGPGQSVTVLLDITMHLPPKQGRWGQWRGITYLSNWLPVFAYYGPRPRGAAEIQAECGKCGLAKGAAGLPADCGAAQRGVLARVLGPPEAGAPALQAACWQPTPFVPWHQPFLNEAGHYAVRVTLPAEQQVACTGSIVARARLPNGLQRVAIEAVAVRDFALLCSARYRVFEGEVKAAPGVNSVKVHVLALPEHEYYARAMVTHAAQAIEAYSRWFGPYPWPDFTIAESYFGWNGNECATLVMIDERVFNMPHIAGGYVEYLISHEVCHQWWYNLIGTDGFCETWMDEGMANYFSHRLLNLRHGRNNALLHYPRGLEWLPNIHREDYRSYGMYGTIGRGENGPIARDMSDFLHLVDLFNHCYDKGGRVVGMLEERLGEAAFFDFLRLVVCRYRHRILRIDDFRRELEAYTGRSWCEFFYTWLYTASLSDWALEKAVVEPHADTAAPHRSALARVLGRPDAEEAPRPCKVTVWLRQKADYDEPTVLGIALPCREGYPIRIPIIPQAGSYPIADPPGRVEVTNTGGGACVRVEAELPEEPTQITVDPDQVLIDRNPANNFWKHPVRWRLAPVYTFLEETDLTCAYDRWNVIFGPWVYGSATEDPWYYRALMLGARAGLYRTQQFAGGVYIGYRPNYRDILMGVDGQWDHWPDCRFQTGFNAERRVVDFYQGDNTAMRGVLWSRYVFQYASSLYLAPMHYAEAYTTYQDNFLPVAKETLPTATRFDNTTTAGVHYHLNYLTPYWDPEGGFQLDLATEAGVADLPVSVGVYKAWGQFAMVKSLPDLSRSLSGYPGLRDSAGPVLSWLGDTRLALRVYAATALPTRGEFFPLGGSDLFRGFDLSQRQGSTVWVGSVEWRVPLAKGLTYDVCDHVLGLRNVWGAAFYDVGDAYLNNRSVGPMAHALGAGLRLDVSWFSFVERTILRLDVAKSLNSSNAVQFWFGVMHPF